MGVQISHGKGQFWGKGPHRKVWEFLPWAVQKQLNQSILPFGLWTQVGWKKYKFNHIRQVAPMCPHGRAHLTPPSEYNWTISLRQRCSLVSHYFDHLLWSPYVIGQTIIFSCCGLFFLSSFFFFFFFPRLISVVGDWMFTILRHMVWP